MIFSSLIALASDRIAKRRRYNRMVDEIESLSARDLADIRGDKTEMLRHARHQVYG
jgi:hypothetical protein